jgi:hypothetical protein
MPRSTARSSRHADWKKSQPSQSSAEAVLDGENRGSMPLFFCAEFLRQGGFACGLK